MKHIYYIWIVIITALFACTEQTPLTPEHDLIVVRGYLFAGEPIDDIQITSTLPLGSEDSTAPPINNAAVSLIKNGKTYDLVPSPGDSGYYHYDGNDLSVQSGDEFEINVSYGGQTAKGKTVVPFPPDSVTISAYTLIIPQYSYGFPSPGEQILPADSNRVLTISWKEDLSSLFYVVVENIDENPEPINNPRMFQKVRRFISVPTNRNEFRIQRFAVTHYGKHVARVYRVNQEYADLYSSRNQDSRDLNEPLSNIENGLGVFSAFASDSVFFEVISE